MIRCSLACLLVTVVALAQEPSLVDPRGVAGARVLAGGGRLPAAVHERFVQLAGGDGSKIVLVPTASATVDTPQAQDRGAATWRQRFPQVTFTVLHTRERSTADSEEFTAPLRAATGVWFGGGAQKRLADTYLGTRFEVELMALVARGGVVGGTSAGTAIASRTMIQEGRDPPIVAQGFDLLPFGILDQHFSQRHRADRLFTVLGSHPGHFGLGIDEGTAVVVAGRELAVIGDGAATLALAATGARPLRALALRAGQTADLVTWQRAARGRQGPAWPPSPMADPVVARGALVLVGGGRLGEAIVARFVALAGGKGAKVVLVPSAEPPMVQPPAQPPAMRGDDAFARRLGAHGVTDVRTFDPVHPREVTGDRLAVLRDATAIWFGGGRQWRLCDAFDGTDALAAFHGVLARGGVIGGTSAGATIQAEFLVRGNPLGNGDEWCEGYDRGFGFLPGCCVDQHFIARHRSDDLRALVAALPQLIGLGIDEGTAAVVQGSVLEVLGDSKVAVFDARKVTGPQRAAPEPAWLSRGERWDLREGARLR